MEAWRDFARRTGFDSLALLQALVEVLSQVHSKVESHQSAGAGMYLQAPMKES